MASAARIAPADTINPMPAARLKRADLERAASEAAASAGRGGERGAAATLRGQRAPTAGEMRGLQQAGFTLDAASVATFATVDSSNRFLHDPERFAPMASVAGSEYARFELADPRNQPSFLPPQRFFEPQQPQAPFARTQPGSMRSFEVSSRGSELPPTGEQGFPFFGPRSGPPSLPRAVIAGAAAR